MKTINLFGYKITIKKIRTAIDRVDTRAVGNDFKKRKATACQALRAEIAK